MCGTEGRDKQKQIKFNKKQNKKNKNKMLSDEEKTYLKNIYFDPKHEASFRGINALYRFVKKDGVYNINRSDIQKFLRSIEVYSTHVAKNKAKNFYGITVPHPGYMYDIDTGFFDMGNGDFTRFIVMVDAFSRKVAARPVKDLRANTVKVAMEEMLNELGPVSTVRSDRGKEYKNQIISLMMKRRNIKQVFSYPPLKAAMAERTIKEIKNKLYKILQSKGRHDWWEFLPDVVKSHNASYNRNLGMSPDEVTPNKIAQLWYKFKRRRMKNMPPFRNYSMR